MKVLVVGSGGREHAICWKLSKSPKVDKIYCAPGNAGIAELAECVDIKAMEFEKLVAFAKENSIDLTVIGMDDPLVGPAHDIRVGREAANRLDRMNILYAERLAVAHQRAGVLRMVGILETDRHVARAVRQRFPEHLLASGQHEPGQVFDHSRGPPRVVIFGISCHPRAV